MAVWVMTDEEVAQQQREWNEWFQALPFNVKSRTYQLVNGLMEQAECEHEWIDPNTYENSLDKTKLFCKCGVTKDIVQS